MGDFDLASGKVAVTQSLYARSNSGSSVLFFDDAGKHMGLFKGLQVIEDRIN